MNTLVFAPRPSRGRRRHSAEYKAQVVAACLQPGISIAAVAMANQLNANLLRSWVNAYREQRMVGVPASINRDRSLESANARSPTLVPVTLQTTDTPPSGTIQIEIRRQETVFQITWPASQATVCAQWLREVLQ